jgi:hypothetical protein
VVVLEVVPFVPFLPIKANLLPAGRKNQYKRRSMIYDIADRHPQVKKAFVSSGIRYDMIFAKGHDTQDNLQYMRDVIHKHVSGRLKVAPEHTSDDVLSVMRKPSFEKFFFWYKPEYQNQVNRELSEMGMQAPTKGITKNPLPKTSKKRKKN